MLATTVFLSAATALLVAGTSLAVADLQQDYGTWIAGRETDAEIVALTIAPALAFNDVETARRNLVALRARRTIQIAAVYGADGALRAQFNRGASDLVPTRLPSLPPGSHAGRGQMEVLQPVELQGEVLGTVYLLARYDLAARLLGYVRILGLILIVSFAAAIVVSRRLRRVISAPLDSMAQVAMDVATTRNYSLRASRERSGEFGPVVDAFNEMLDEVQRQARAVAAEIATRKAAEGALLEADRRKDEFLATLAHELRNPLAPIRNAVRVLEQPEIDDRQRRWGRDVISRQVRNMALLLDDLLDVSRITRGKLELKRCDVTLGAVLASAVEIARPLIDTKRHRLTLRVPHGEIGLHVDPLRLSQVIGNLLTNAAKYTDPEGEIRLEVDATDDGVCLSVVDNGIGLSAESVPQLFQMFSQVNSAIDRSEGGLGIGLALVKGLVELHGGRVEARSEGRGRGSEFRIWLPREVRVARPSVANPVTGSHASGRDAAGRRVTILVTDDNLDAAESLAIMLDLAGYAVQTASTGESALECAARERPQILLLDIGLPDMDGYAVARHVRLTDWGRKAFLVAITGWGQATDVEAARAAGFDRHFTKPVDPATLERVLREYVGAIRPTPREAGAWIDGRRPEPMVEMSPKPPPATA